jgi:restriction system protein
MSNFGATRGLLVSWGGFKSSAISEAQKHYFQVRLWDSDQLLRAIFEHYERLPEDIQAELPLKRVWPWSGQWRIE